MEKNVLLRLIKTQFGEYKDGGSDIQVNCPFCILRGRTADTGFKLYISINKDVYHCFRCDSAGRTSRLFPQLASYGTVFDRTVVEDDKQLESLPEGFRLRELPEGHVARNFIQNRGFTCDELDSKVLYCPEYRKGNLSFGQRILFPIAQFGSYRGFQARALDNKEPKYIGATSMVKKTILYNFDEAFLQDEELVIVEGFFDCLKVGSTGVAVMGKAVSDEQLRLIRLGRFKRVVVLLDKDAKKEVKETAAKLAPYFTTFVGFLDKKDPGEMSHEELRHFLTYKIERVF